MTWPIGGDFSKSLQNPRLGLKPPELHGLTIERTRLGQPRPWSGAFAVVYKGTDAAGRSVALRVFTSEVPERIERYDAISAFLGARRPDSIVGFQFHPEGVQANGRWYPLVVMDWVQGDTLFDWAKGRCAGGDGAALARAADQWVVLVAALATANIAHGDLQHANVMVTDRGELKLVDYDCMAVPALFGRRNLEIGVEPYQHPDRTDNTPLTPDLDRYSALFILVALKALAADPGLWQRSMLRTGDADEYDKLLIRCEDLDHPTASPLAAALRRSPDTDVRDLFDALVDLRRGPMRAVPPLGDVAVSFRRLEEALRGRDWAEAVAQADRCPPAKLAKLPPALKPGLLEARQRVECRAKLEAAAAAGDEDALAQHYRPALVDDWPAARAVADVARSAARVAPVVRRLAAALKADGRAAVVLWDQHQALLAGRVSAARLQPQVQAWRGRNDLCDAVLRHLANPAANGAALGQLWDQLERVGGHPETAPHRAAILQLVRRNAAWAALQAVPAAVTEAADAQFVGAWDEPLFAGWPPADKARPRLAAAQQRLAFVAALRPLAGRPNPDEEAEQRLAAAAGRLPAGYDPDVEERARVAAARLAAVKQFRAARAAAKPSDVTLATAWDQLTVTGGGHLVAPPDRERGDLAARRRDKVNALNAIPPKAPLNDRDQAILRAYDPKLLADCPDAAAWHKPFAAAAARFKKLVQLKKALEADDALTAVILVNDPLLAGYPFDESWRPRLDRLLKVAGAVAGLQYALQARDLGRFEAAFDAATVRQYARELAPHRDALNQLLAAMLAPGRVGPGPLAFHRPGVVPAPAAGGYELRWTWPERRFTDWCRVAVCRGRVGPTARPDDVAPLYAQAVSRTDYEAAGGAVPLAAEPAWDGATAVVWAEIDVGYRRAASAPLVLGALTADVAGNRY
jgi:hypothetical protein